MRHDTEAAHVLLDWADTLRQQPVWHLPQEVKLLPRASAMRPWQVELLGVVLGVLSVAAWTVYGVWQGFALFAAGMLVYSVVQWRQGLQRTAIYHLDMGRGHEGHAQWKGCVVNLPERTVQSVGHQRAWHAALEDAPAWSLGLRVVGGRRENWYVLELRHVRQGPVGALCTLRNALDLGHSDLEAIDAWVDAMAQCLGIRRSGARLRPLARTCHPKNTGA